MWWAGALIEDKASLPTNSGGDAKRGCCFEHQCALNSLTSKSASLKSGRVATKLLRGEPSTASASWRYRATLLL